MGKTVGLTKSLVEERKKKEAARVRVEKSETKAKVGKPENKDV